LLSSIITLNISLTLTALLLITIQILVTLFNSFIIESIKILKK